MLFHPRSPPIRSPVAAGAQTLFAAKTIEQRDNRSGNNSRSPVAAGAQTLFPINTIAEPDNRWGNERVLPERFFVSVNVLDCEKGLGPGGDRGAVRSSTIAETKQPLGATGAYSHIAGRFKASLFDGRKDLGPGGDRGAKEQQDRAMR